MESAKKIKELMEGHEKWRSECINLIASENISSPSVHEACASGFMHKYAEGWPHQRYYQGCHYVDEAELQANSMFYQLFEPEYVDLRPVSGAVANMSMFLGLTKPGDTILSLHTSHGGHITHAQFGAAGMRGLNVETFPFDHREMNIDADAMKKKIREVKPKIVLFGCSMFLFPHPVKEAVEAAREVGAVVAYDAAHVLGLIAGKGFQDPFREGAQMMTASTHKTFPGPQGGCIMFSGLDQTKAANVQWCIFPVMMSNHHLHHVAAKGIAGAEMIAFGKDYVTQILKNAKAFASTLCEQGLGVLAEHKGFTESHQVLIDFKEPIGKWAAQTLEKANIITNKNLMPWDPQENSDNPSGMRLGVQEMTRVGMRESEMKHIAELFRKVIVDKKDPEKIKQDVAEFRKGYQKVLFCFD